MQQGGTGADNEGMKPRQLIVLVAGIAVMAWLAVYGPGPVHRRNQEAASALRQKVAAALAADPRFAKVHLFVDTHPTLSVSGEVADRQALADLERLVPAPPAGAGFEVSVNVQVAADIAAALEAARGGESGR